MRDLAVLVDPDGNETIASIAVGDPARFIPLRGGSLTAGYRREVHWLRFALAAPFGDWYLDILPPFLDDLLLYAPDPDQPGGFSERRAGRDLLPFSAREVPYHGFISPCACPLGRGTSSICGWPPPLAGSWSRASGPQRPFPAAASLEAGLLRQPGDHAHRDAARP